MLSLQGVCSQLLRRELGKHTFCPFATLARLQTQIGYPVIGDQMLQHLQQLLLLHGLKMELQVYPGVIYYGSDWILAGKFSKR
jgi:hypothetical protein